MEDYPRNLKEFDVRFRSEEACREYLFELRGPDGFRCPRCGCRESSPVRTVLLRCRACRHQTSATAGTIFQDTRTSLRLWFQAMWWVTTQKNGASALGLQRILGLKRYETAWTMLHKLRRAMVRPGRDLLTGRVEVDECYIGGLEEGLPGRLNLDKALIVVAAQEDGPGIGRIRMRQIVDASAQSLVPFAQGAVSHKHLDYYLDEFTFRFNRRRSKSRGKLFFRLVQQALAVEPVPLDRILHPGRKVKTETTICRG